MMVKCVQQLGSGECGVFIPFALNIIYSIVNLCDSTIKSHCVGQPD